MSDSEHDSHDAPSSQHSEPRRKRGVLGGLTRIGSIIVFAIILFAAGFYVGLLAIGAQGGPTVSTYREGEGGRRIAIIPISGLINSETAHFVHEVLDVIREDPSIHAIVLRVSSPGGTISASDQIWHELHMFREDRSIPIIASYGALAASGGYYVSCFADKIYAEPTTITGSIGVIANAFTVEELLEDKLGIHPRIITSDPAYMKDLLSPFHKWGQKAVSELQEILNTAHARFVDVVAKGRSEVLTRDEVADLAIGDAYTAAQALDLELIDAIGYLDDALATATARGEFQTQRPPVIKFHPQQGFFSWLGIFGRASQGGGVQKINARTIRKWLLQLSTPRIMYMMRL